jgi:hypothetical protein
MHTESRPKNDVIERVRKLLEMQSGRGCTEAEAATAYRMASRLMAEYNLDMSEIENTSESDDWVTEPADGQSGKYIRMEWKMAANICQSFFFVKGIFIRNRVSGGMVTHFFGRPANVETARFVYVSLLSAAETLWDRYRVRVGCPGSERRTFVAGLMAGFTQKLKQERRTIETERDLLRDGESAPGSTGTALATIDDRTDLAFKKAHTNTKKGSAYRNPSGDRDTFDASHRAGRNLNLNRPIGGNRPTPDSSTIEVSRDDLRIGDVLISKRDRNREFHIEAISTGIYGHGWPYLTMRDGDGNKVEHDTSLDSTYATYTIRSCKSEQGSNGNRTKGLPV